VERGGTKRQNDKKQMYVAAWTLAGRMYAQEGKRGKDKQGEEERQQEEGGGREVIVRRRKGHRKNRSLFNSRHRREARRELGEGFAR